MTRSLALVAALASLQSGCSKSQPIVAGGKPAAYWVKTLKEGTVSLRRSALVKLGNIGPEDKAAFPAVLDALRDREPSVRKEAILALLKFGPTAGQALPVLDELGERDPDPEVRNHAHKAGKKLRGSS
jgi:HEAT repeat protein